MSSRRRGVLGSDFRNPQTFLGRFLCHFSLAFSAILVAQVVLFLTGQLDVIMGLIWLMGFSTLFGLIRAYISKPGSSFWGSPFAQVR